MKASIGRTVIVQGLSSNGAPETAAVITRVWGGQDTVEKPVMVNLTMFPDCGPPTARGSVMLYDTKELALAAAHNDPSNALTAHWPERV